MVVQKKFPNFFALTVIPNDLNRRRVEQRCSVIALAYPQDAEVRKAVIFLKELKPTCRLKAAGSCEVG
jgi:hypothetical protein